MPKISRFNHFQPWQGGYHIAYNARSGAVALMTEENFRMYEQLVEKLKINPQPELDDKERELMKQLEYGMFVCPDDTDEHWAMRFRRDIDRYNQTGLGLVIAPTMACNMACKYCYEDNKTGRMSPQIVEAIVDFVEKRAPHLDQLSANWYGGEPLLAMDIIEDLSETFMDLAKEHHFEYGSSMVSNGYLLKKENVDRLIDLKVRYIQITIDGPARIHNLKRPLKNGKPSYDTIIENIQYAKTKMGVGIRVNIDKSFTPEIIQELLDDLNSADLREKIGIYFGHIEPATQVCANISESCYEATDFSKIETEYYKIMLKNGFRIEKLPEPISSFCMAQLVSSFLIDPQGELYRCFNHVGDIERSMGNIREEVNYQNQNFVRLFDFNPFEDDLCRECNLLPVCMGGCPSRRVDRGITGEEMCQTWKHNLRPMLEIIAKSRQQQQQREAAAAAKE